MVYSIMEIQKVHSSYNNRQPGILLRTNTRILIGSLSHYSVRFFVLKINERTTLQELDRRCFIDFELHLDRSIHVIVRGKVKEDLGKSLFLFEVGQVDYFQAENFIGSSRIIHPIVSFYDENSLSHAGLLEETSAYEMALSMKSIPRNLSVGQIFKGVNIQLGLSEALNSKLFLKKISANRESYVLLFQISGLCQTLIRVVSTLSVFNHKSTLSPIFYNKEVLERISENTSLQVRDKLLKAHRDLSLELSGEGEGSVSLSLGDTSLSLIDKNKMSLEREGRKVSPPETHWFFLSEILHREADVFSFKNVVSNSKRPNHVSFENPFINPEWTKPDLAPGILIPYITVADEMMGIKKTNQCLLELGIDRSYFINRSNWVSVEFLDKFVDDASKHCDIVGFQKRVGEELANQGFLESHFGFPGRLSSLSFGGVNRFFSRFDRTRTYTYRKISHTSGLIQVGLGKGYKLPKSNHSCEVWKASLEIHIKTVTGSTGKLRKLACCYTGDKSCDYKVEWSPTKSRRIFIFLAPMFILLFVWLYMKSGLWLTWPILAGFLLFKLFFSFRMERNNLIEALNLHEESSLQKYNELQDSKNKACEMYHEAKIISEVTSRVHSFEKVESIFLLTLKDICIQLKYDRAFVMLPDDSMECLRVKSAYGFKGEGLKIWNYVVKTGQVETVKFISTAFQTGQSLLITDLESRYSQLNKELKFIVGILQPENICVVPVRAKKESVGVLVVERKRSVGMMSRRDLTLLERVSRTLGLSIEKEKRYERESLLRRSFQKFVPTRLVEDFLEKKTDTLKGEEKDVAVVIC